MYAKVQVEQKSMLLMKKGIYLIGIIIEIGRVFIGRIYRPPLVSLPAGVPGNPDVGDLLSGPAAMLHRNHQGHRAIGCQDQATVSPALFDKILMFFDEYRIGPYQPVIIIDRCKIG